MVDSRNKTSVQKKAQKKSKVYIGKIKESTITSNSTGQQFNKLSILMDNINPTNKDGTVNQYHKGLLLWFDASTGKYYQVKQIDLGGVSDQDAQRGCINSLSIDLENKFQVEEIK